jgi:hypothetical protein
VLLSLFLVCFVALSLTTVLLVIAGHRLRVAFRLLGSFCAIVLAIGSGEIAASIWRLKTSYVWAGEAFLLSGTGNRLVRDHDRVGSPAHAHA